MKINKFISYIYVSKLKYMSIELQTNQKTIMFSSMGGGNFLNNFKILTAFLLSITFFTSCKKNEFLQPRLTEQNVVQTILSENPEYTENDLILGDKLQNPYTVTNMVAAYDYLLETGNFECSQIIVRPTHYYVQFAPTSIIQYELLDNDSTVNLSDHPLDVAILHNGNHYHDPSLAADEITYQYAAVKIGYNFNDTIPYKILDTLYIP